MTCKLVSVLTSETEAGSREAAPRPDPEACRQRDRGWASVDCCRRWRSRSLQNRWSLAQPQMARMSYRWTGFCLKKTNKQEDRSELSVMYIYHHRPVCYNKTLYTLICPHLLSAPAPSVETPEPATYKCVSASVWVKHRHSCSRGQILCSLYC